LGVPVGRSLTIAAAAGLVLSAAAAAILVSHLPFSLRALHDEASAARGRNQLGGALAAADQVALPAGLVTNAFVYVPRQANYAVELPSNQAQVEKLYDVNPTTFAAAPTLLQNFLLPRRKVKVVAAGTYVLCFYCDEHWHHRMHWLWDNQNGSRIGVLRG
jgi:hypothetical protein